MTDPPDDLFALPADEPLPDHQPVPPLHPDRRGALETAYREVADALDGAARERLARLRAGPACRVAVIGGTRFRDDVPWLLAALGVPHRVLEVDAVGSGEGRTGSPRTLDDLAGVETMVVQCVGPSAPPSDDALRTLADRVAAGATLLSTCRALEVVAPAFLGGAGAPLADGPRAATEVAVRPRFGPAGGSLFGRSGGADVRWQVEGGAPETRVDADRVEVLAEVGERVPGWSTEAAPLWVRFRHGEGHVHHLAGHLRMTWCGETAGDPWGTGEAGDAPTPAERASVRSLVTAFVWVLTDG